MNKKLAFFSIVLLTLLLSSLGSEAATMGVAKTHVLITDKITTGLSTEARPLSNIKSFHGFGSVTASTGAATIEIQVSNDCVNYYVVDTLSLTLGTTVTSDTYENNGAWKCVRGNVATISGTNAKVSLIMGAQL